MRQAAVILLLFLSSQSFSQMKRLLRDKAEEAMQQKNWYGAEQYYSRLYARDSSLKVAWPFAEAARFNNNTTLAQSLYAKVAGADEGKRYPLAYYWLGQVMKTREKYTDSKKWFARFLQLQLPDEKFSYYNKKAALESEACDLAIALRRKPLFKSLESVGSTFNTRSSEFAAIERDSAIYFSAVRVPDKRDPGAGEPKVYGRIFRSEKRRGKWTRPKPLDTLINAMYTHNANPAFSPDGGSMMFSRCATKNAAEYDCALYESIKNGGKWDKGKKLPEPVNMTGYTSTQPHLARIDSVTTILFFVSDRPGGLGGLDIWMAPKRQDGSYAAPVNAGPRINTVDDELTPWFRNSDSSLYFSSSYHKGMGGVDIFRSRYLNKSFGEPVNAGYPVNSGYNDLYFTVNTAGNTVYIASNRVGSVSESKYNCCSDIYFFRTDTAKPVVPPPPIDTVKVKEQEMRLLVPLTLYFHNDEPDPRTKNVVTTKNYENLHNTYMKMRPLYAESYAGELQGDARDQAIEEIEVFFTDSVDAGNADLKRFTQLLEEVLAKGETVKITMKGYCSPLASTDYNINLAKRRISSLRNYFMQTKNGVFQKYVNAASGAQIIFEEVEVGELVASKVSDNLKDKRSSVYSPNAASERKIQIIAISFGN
jgi:hypothetical protein